jgi:hypothetical protein
MDKAVQILTIKAAMRAIVNMAIALLERRSKNKNGMNDDDRWQIRVD